MKLMLNFTDPGRAFSGSVKLKTNISAIKVFDAGEINTGASVNVSNFMFAAVNVTGTLPAKS